MSKSIEFRKYKSEDKQGIKSILSIMWDNLDKNEVSERLEWRYFNNLYQKEPFIYIALDGEKIVGFRAFVCQLFSLKGNTYKILSPADAIINPEYRRMGIFSKLNDIFIDDISSTKDAKYIILNLSANEKSTPGNLKLGWVATDGLKNYLYKFSLLNTLKVLFSNKKHNNQVNKSKYNNISVSTDLLIGDLVIFNQEHLNRNKLTNVHDENYYKWRYDNPKDIIFIYNKNDSKLTSYFIIKKRSNKHYSLLEYGFTNRYEFKKTLKYAVRKLAIPILSVYYVSKPDFELFKYCGMIKEPNITKKIRKKKTLPVLVRPTTKDVKASDFVIDGLDIREISNWQIYPADIH